MPATTIDASRFSWPRQPNCIGRGRPCAGPHPVQQDALRPAHGRHPRASWGTLSETRDGPDAPRAGGRAGGWAHADDAPGVAARRSGAYVSAPCRPLRPRRVRDHGARSRRGRTSRGTHDCGRHETHTRQPPSHKNRTGLLWLDKFHRSACNFLRKILHSASCRRDNACPVC